MNRVIIGIVFGFVFLVLLAIGFVIGFAFALYYQNQIPILAATAVSLGFLTWIGSGVDLLGILRQWYAERNKEENTPAKEALPWPTPP